MALEPEVEYTPEELEELAQQTEEPLEGDTSEYGEEYAAPPQSNQSRPNNEPKKKPEDDEKDKDKDKDKDKEKNKEGEGSEKEKPEGVPKPLAPNPVNGQAQNQRLEDQNKLTSTNPDVSVNEKLFPGGYSQPLSNDPNRNFPKAPNPSNGASKLGSAASDTVQHGTDAANTAAKAASTAGKAASTAGKVAETAEGAVLDPGGELAKQAALKLLGTSRLGRAGATVIEAGTDLAEIIASGGVLSFPIVFKYATRYWKLLAILLGAALFLFIILPLIILLLLSGSSFKGDQPPPQSRIAPLQANALPNDFNPNFIMSDELALKNDTMTEQDIYHFLQDHHSVLIDKKLVDDAGGLNYAECHPMSATDYDCAAQIIFNAARLQGFKIDGKTTVVSMNPQLILVRLATEQSLTGTISAKSYDAKVTAMRKKLNRATGYGAPDSGPWSTTGVNFKEQVYNFAGYASYWIREGQAPKCHSLGEYQSHQCFELNHKLVGGSHVRPDGNYDIQNEANDIDDHKILRDHNLEVSTKIHVTILNSATAVFYSYTPSVYIGAYNLWLNMNSWFRNTADTQGIAQVLGAPSQISGGINNGNVADCATVANNPNVIINHSNDKEGLKGGTGFIKRVIGDSPNYPVGQAVKIDTRMCTLLKLFLASPEGSKTKLMMNVWLGEHPEFVADTNNTRRSDHWFGRGLDINEKDYGIARYLMPWIASNYSSLKAAGVFPSQVIGPKNSDFDGKSYVKYSVFSSKVSGSFYVKGHNNHVHIGFAAQ